MKDDDIGKDVEEYYRNVGWKIKNGISENARLFGDSRECNREYFRKCARRVFNNIPKNGENILDVGSGSLRPKVYQQYSSNFKKRYCVDLSLEALEHAKKNIGEHGVFLHGNFLEIPLNENFFDCAISLHAIYHIDKDKQEYAIRKLIKVTKPGNPIIVVYQNPKSICSSLLTLYRILRTGDTAPPAYNYPNKWWDRQDIAEVKILPYQSLPAQISKKLIPNNKVGQKLLCFLYLLEDRFPHFFAKYFQYPMIILTKKR